MKIAIMPCRSAPRGLKVFFGCLLLCLLACLPALAQDENVTWVGADLKDYAKLSFAVPKEFEDMVEAESLSEGNYTEGRYVGASLLINEGRIYIYLLYPCQLPETWLDALGVISVIESFNAGLNQTIYSSTPLNVSDQPAIWGQFDNFALIAYQPSYQTVSVIFIDENVTEGALEYFPEYLQINVSESSSPLWPGYCAGEDEADVVSAQAVSVTEQTEQAVQTDSEFNKTQMESDLEDIKEQMDRLRHGSL
jgi:hypothetical protein